MCLSREVDNPDGSDSGAAAAAAAAAPPKQDDDERAAAAWRPRPGAVESYSHSKRVGNYLIGRELGSGSFATVHEALHAVTGERVAVKVINKATANADPYVAKNMRREGRILQLIRHPNVVRLLEVMETEHSYYLVMELCQGGDFMTHLVRRRRLTESETRRFIRQMVQAVDYLHSLGVLHRDLKIENLLLTRDQNLKIIDFGLSNMVQAVQNENGSIVTQLCRTQCGSPAYAAPEVLARKPYGTAVDVWSIGVNMFAMLTGDLPFTVKPFNIKALHQRMVNQEMNPLPRTASASCRDLLMWLLNPQPETRIKLTDVMTHPWLNDSVSSLKPSPFPNLMTRADLHQEVLHQVSQQLALPVTEAARKVVDNVPSPCLATYHLLLAKAERNFCIARVQSIVQAEKAEQRLPAAAASSVQQQQPQQPANDEGGSCGGGPEVATQCSPVETKALSLPEAPPRAHLPRREMTFAGRCLALSSSGATDASAEASELVSLDRGGARGSRTARTVRLPGVRSKQQQQPHFLPQLRRIRTEVGSSSIQSLVSQRYHQGAFKASPALPPPPPPPPHPQPALICPNLKAAGTAAAGVGRFAASAATRRPVGAAAVAAADVRSSEQFVRR